MNPPATFRRAALLLATALPAAPAFAADLAETAAPPGDEIIVTARRRTEDVQAVPIAVSVLSAATLDATGTFNVARVTQLQPSVQFFTSNPRNTAINIRGIGAPFGLTNDGIEQGVGFYIDQVYYGRIAASTLDFVDVGQVEVLRRPQGTLYGKNSTAGAMNISTRTASFDPEARLELSAGSLGLLQAKASVSGPLVADRLAARLSTSVTRRNGTLDNVTTGRDVNNVRNIGVRGQLLWHATDDLQLTLRGDWNRQNPEAYAQNYVKVVETLRNPSRQFANLAALSGYQPASRNPFDYRVDADSELTAKNTHGGVSLTADWDIGPATITSITAWRNWDWQPSNDRDFTGLPITTISANPSQQEQFSQEVRLVSNGRNRFDYVLGAFWFQQTINTQGVQQQGSAASLWLLGPANGSNPALLDGLRSDNDISYANKSLAFFGKLTWNINDQWSIAPGLRVNYDEKRGRYDATISGGIANPTPAQQALINGVLQNQHYAASYRDWNLSGDVTLAWRPAERLNLYATYARSFKSGGINLSGLPTRADGVTPATELASVLPEKVNHYELGVKSQWLDRALTVNIAAFRSDISDYQATVVSGAVGVLRGYLANVPSVRSQGIEADVRARPSANFDAYLNYAFIDATYRRFPGAPPPVELSSGSVAFVDASGGRLPGVSRHALSYGFEWRMPAEPAGGSVFAGVDGSLKSDFSSNPTPSAVMNIDGHAITNLRAGFRAHSHWEIFGWVRNAFNTRYFDFLTAAPGATGLIVGQPGDPRTWGATASFSF